MVELQEVLEQARRRGSIGTGDLQAHVDHAGSFVDLLSSLGDVQRVLDLGSGGGLPGLVIADRLPRLQLTLLESRLQRAQALTSAVSDLGFGSHVQVVADRAEIAGRDPVLRGRFDAVVSRSFGQPGVTAECAAPFLRQGGWLVVAEPPAQDDDHQRWPVEGCALVGLEVVKLGGSTYQMAVLRQKELCADRYPRRTGIPSKRPLF